MSRRPVDLQGVRLGMLVAEYPTAERSSHEKVVWACRCDCGNIVLKDTGSIRGAIRAKHNSNCGCLGKQRLAAGGVRKLTYIAWKSMNNRCHNPNNKDYKYYGAKGIKVCSRWRAGNPESFFNFLSDMGEKSLGQSMGRFGDVGDYCPENCKWMTASEQGAERAKKYQSQKVSDPILATM